MRPTPEGVGNVSPARCATCRIRCFNEAHARRRGKSATASSPAPPRTSFNEAHARRRGKLSLRGDVLAGVLGFNEAHARRRGKFRSRLV